MIFDQKGNTTTITQEKATTIELVKKLQALYPKYKNNNIIITLTTLKPITREDIAEFLVLAKMHKTSKQSFVIVTDKIDLDLVPDGINVVPTLQEAHDFVEMEDMERDLGL